ncbi:hypothetical protein SPRG_14713 [Saprolegnia parasitica CBS 223.65]|uniref:Uncharacterized protein n=1 Tax=Saprolegnia parasitica (strain CBS 223.65) TaxID=695850 RepID=A0A067BLJ2_SAPPC|nr:hypothetical protein SPRG_14713 [Saprolegnia parasitica CBS 223.65]KDO19078.1 hypothetical protein SPRG_14713 [Saprolegnia parasitica CBS 223.65]|eukprot:XP_012210205.1 hypothetical protein SPRG_14713 [Saprolegnia parasitica CBS 223.65]
MSLLRVLGLCGVFAMALVSATAMNSTTVPTNKTGNLRVEDAALNWPDLTDKWGVQRVLRSPHYWVPVERYNSYMTIWNTIVNTRRANDAGGKVWHVLKSNGVNEFNMLRNVQDDLCLDAWWNPAANKPFVHGYKCNRDEVNQRWEWEFNDWNRGTMIRSKRHIGCMEMCSYENHDLFFQFRQWKNDF